MIFTSPMFARDSRARLYVQYLIVGGGGNGAPGFNERQGGHGGGGGVLTGAFEAVGAYAVTVGSGGASLRGDWPRYRGANGEASSIAGVATAEGGGGGGHSQGGAGQSGGSGGGGGSEGGSGGAGTSGQGNAGGGSSGSSIYGGGGGGAGAAGQSATSDNIGTPAAGVVSTITGAAVEYGKGGAGGVSATLPGQGGSGSFTTTPLPGAGGIVVIRYPGEQRATGGAVTSVGGYTVHIFTTSGTFTVNES